MADLYLDNDVSLSLVPLLQATGHDVTSARGLGLRTIGDDAQLLTAAQRRRVLITHNRRDFLMLHDAWLTWPAAFGLAFPPHPGILVPDQAPPAALMSALNAFLRAIPPASLANAMFWWHRPPQAGWRRRLVGTGWAPYP